MTLQRKYFPVDGGAGAEFFARLPGVTNRLQVVSIPRHADILLIHGPVSEKLAGPVLEIYRTIPRPRNAVVIADDNNQTHHSVANFSRISEDPQNVGAIASEILGTPLNFDEVPAEPHIEPETIPVPNRDERDIATEPIVYSLGPVQPFTAGPLRVLLVCDGEQVISTRIQSGYASRHLVQRIERESWPGIADLAASFDPLAPIAGRLALITCLERLSRISPDPTTSQRREAALAWERARNHLGWLVRFATALDYGRLEATARKLLNKLIQDRSPASLEADVSQLRNRLAQDRALRLRTAGTGSISATRLRQAGVSGPALHTSETDMGDVQSRLLQRLQETAEDLHRAAAPPELPGPAASIWPPQPGKAESQIRGPRGNIGISLASDGTGLAEINLSSPSAALLNVLPELLAGQKLADAEVILASLDLSMAEADA